MKKKALGKGLKAFLPEDYGILKEDRFVEMELENLKPNPLQPRTSFDQGSIEELARSIKETGVLQPLVVVPSKDDDRFTIIVGERRWRAAQKIGLQKIPVIIRNLNRAQQLEASLIENLQREDLNPLEIANAYQKMMEELGYTQQETADKVGKDRASVANYLRLLKLPEEVKEHLAQGRISMGHARALLALENPSDQIALTQQVIRGDLSVREVERRIQRIKKQPQKREEKEADPNLMAFQEELIKTLGTKVSIAGNSQKGILKIYYYSLNDLNRIYVKIKGARS